MMKPVDVQAKVSWGLTSPVTAVAGDRPDKEHAYTRKPHHLQID